MGQHLAEVAPDPSRCGGHPAEVHPVALVAGGGAAGLGARIADDEGRVFAEKNIPHIAPLAEIVAIGRGGDLTGRQGRRAVSGRPASAVGRKESRDAVADFVPGLPTARRAENLHALGPEDHIRRGVVKGKIQHQLDSALIGREGKIPESGHGCGVVGRIRRGVVQIAVVAAGVEGIDLPEVADRVRTTRIVGLVVVGRIGLASFQPLRMEWLEPDPVDPEILQPGDIDPFGRIVEILEGPAAGEVGCRGVGIGHMQFVDAHVAGDLRRHDHGMVADPGTAQPGPRIVRTGPVAGGDPVGPGLEHGKIQLVGAVVVRVGHRIGLEISPGVGRRGQVAIRRKNAILDPVIVEVIIRPVAVVQVGEDLDLRGDPGVHPHGQGGETRVVVLVEVEVGFRIVAIRSVDRKDRAGRGHGEGKRIGLRCGLDGSHRVARINKGR